MARNHQRTAGVGIAAGLIPAFIVQVTAQQAGHKGIAGAQHVQYLDPYAGMQFDLLPVGGDLAFEDRAALRAAFADQRGLGGFAYIAQRGQRVGAAAGNVKLFFGTDD
ncbi:hypothetical protein D3C79_967870 [compost metagenome]